MAGKKFLILSSQPFLAGVVICAGLIRVPAFLLVFLYSSKAPAGIFGSIAFTGEYPPTEASLNASAPGALEFEGKVTARGVDSVFNTNGHFYRKVAPIAETVTNTVDKYVGGPVRWAATKLPTPLGMLDRRLNGKDTATSGEYTKSLKPFEGTMETLSDLGAGFTVGGAVGKANKMLGNMTPFGYTVRNPVIKKALPVVAGHVLNGSTITPVTWFSPVNENQAK